MRRGLKGGVGAWTAFLDTASRLYKYPFAYQLMVRAQQLRCVLDISDLILKDDGERVIYWLDFGRAR